MKKIVLGTLAHVDAGKTTLSEALLYHCRSIRTFGRVDHQNSFLDYDLQERQRGITISLKQAVFSWNNTEFTLLDTPGHTDFSAEMERTLQVLDYAILLISASDGIQAHTRTIWKLLESYHLPVFLFINKMDLAYRDEQALMNEIRSMLSDHCVSMNDANNLEQLAMCSDALLDSYMENGTISKEELSKAIQNREIFPCWFGSALKQQGIEEFMNGLDCFTQTKNYSDEFGARVFKITRDPQGNRLTHIKITGGTLQAKSIVNNEKIDQIRIYSGNKFVMVQETSAGTVCCLKGPQNIQIHDGLGFENKGRSPLLSSCLGYRILLPVGTDPFQAFRQFKQLEEENPELRLDYDSTHQQIRIEMMGEIQTEVLKQTIADRFNLNVDFDEGQINYKETISQPVEGIGHYEPLRHYAEVHLLLEPLKPGSGLLFETLCPTDTLEAHWQKLILSILDSTELTGVLTNSLLTDMKITLLTGKAHLKHTEGADFRQATLRALRQGLRSTQSVLLEPIYRFEMEIPNEAASRALFDLDKMNAEYTIHQDAEGKTHIQGTAPVSKMQNYQTELKSYTRGSGTLLCIFDGYQPCGNQDEVVEAIGYDCGSDIDHPADSVFCSHGAGFNVKWDNIDEYMHLERAWQPAKIENSSSVHVRHKVNDEELKAVMARTYKQKERPKETKRVVKKELPEHMPVTITEKKTECLLVDGYNMIHSWQATKSLADEDLANARDLLIQILMNYQGYRKGILIIVFDAWKVKENPGSITQKDNTYIVYTKTSQTADTYIEKATHRLAKEYKVTVATSDGMEQLIILGQGALRLSARELELQVLQAEKKNRPNQPELKIGHRPMQDLKKKFYED